MSMQSVYKSLTFVVQILDELKWNLILITK